MNKHISDQTVSVNDVDWKLSHYQVPTHGTTAHLVEIWFAGTQAGTLKVRHTGKVDELTRTGFMIPKPVFNAAKRMI